MAENEVESTYFSMEDRGPVDVSLSLYELTTIGFLMNLYVDVINAGVVADQGDEFFDVLESVGYKLEEAFNILAPDLINPEV